MKKQWIILAAVVLLTVFAFYQTSSASKEELPKVGFKAPKFALKGLDGKTYSLDNLDGKPVVVNFWASWCGPCKLEAPELVKLAKKYNGSLQVYAVNLTSSDTLENAKAFAAAYGFNFPVILDEMGTVSERYAVQVIPTTYFVDKNGIIVDKVLGLLDPVELDKKFQSLASKR